MAPTSTLPQALVARGLTKRYGSRTVLDGVDLVAAPGRPVGLVGENGSGKSTLLRLLAGLEPPDAGEVARPGDLAHLGQDPSFPAGATLGGVLAAAVAPLTALVEALEQRASTLDGDPAAADEFDALLARATVHEAWSAGQRAEEAADRLGLAGLDRTRPVAALSGGERSRLALAAVVVRRPGCLLLDEPTNHLDDRAVALLEEVVTGLPGVVVVASHDRAFLDAVAAEVVDLEPGHLGTDGRGGRRFGGGYTDYLAAQRAARRRWEATYSAQQEQLSDLRTALRTTARAVAPHARPPRDNDKIGHHGHGQKVQRAVSRRVRDAERRLAVLERDQVPRPRPPLSFRGELAAEAAAGPVVRVRGLRVAGRLDVPSLDLAGGERLLVTGANGSGKSTLLRVLAGRVRPDVGELQVRARHVGHLPQEVRFARPDLPARRTYDLLTGTPVPLEAFGLLHPRDLHRPVGELSTGQRRRLALAVLMAGRADLVLLDEPTNHLSLALAEELEEALGRSPGTVVVASHDRWLRRRWDGPGLALSLCAW